MSSLLIYDAENPSPANQRLRRRFVDDLKIRDPTRRRGSPTDEIVTKVARLWAVYGANEPFFSPRGTSNFCRVF
jgi:hypothetical protein